MGSSISCFRPLSCTQGLPKEEDSDDQNAGFGMYIIKFMRHQCLWIDEEKDKMQMDSLEDEEQRRQLIYNTKLRTSEEWLLASPCLNNKNCSNFGGEYYMHKSVSPKFHDHSSLCGDDKEDVSQSLERLLELDEVEEEEELSRSQSCKSKRRVSFKSPEEADIFIFYPTE